MFMYYKARAIKSGIQNIRMTLITEFLDHNKGRVMSTKSRIPLKLIYFEACLKMYDALAREKYLKSGMGKRYLRNRLKRYLGDL